MTEFGPTAPLANLRRRAELLAGVRRFLTDRGYWEVETPLLSHDVCVDAHLEPFVVPSAGNMYLQTSPEFGMKRLLAAGSGSIFQVTRSFRHGEVGPLHNPEFTIIEWYRVAGTYCELMDEVGALCTAVGGWPMPERITYADAFRRFAGIDPFAAPDLAGLPTEPHARPKVSQEEFAANRELAALAEKHGFHAASAARDDILNFLLAALVEPHLGTSAPSFIYDYPPAQAALSRIRRDHPDVAERFELYYRGIEICNGFQELTDADELRRRNHTQNELRQRHGRGLLPPDSRLLSAMDRGLPECAGVAFGFDRFAMLTLGAATLADVMTFPQSIA